MREEISIHLVARRLGSLSAISLCIIGADLLYLPRQPEMGSNKQHNQKIMSI
jgi:hypothetical protein